MRSAKPFIFLGAVLFTLFSCSPSCPPFPEETLYSQWQTVLNNHGCDYNYEKDGQCFGDGDGISKANFEKMFIGNGWKHYCTWEIDHSGKRLSNEYYTNMIGPSPVYYFFDSLEKLTTYWHSDASGKTEKESIAYTFNEKYNGTNRSLILLDSGDYLQITGLNQGGLPSFCIVHKLCLRNGKDVYGVSIYSKMSDKEMTELKNSVK